MTKSPPTERSESATVRTPLPAAAVRQCAADLPVRGACSSAIANKDGTGPVGIGADRRVAIGRDVVAVADGEQALAVVADGHVGAFQACIVAVNDQPALRRRLVANGDSIVGNDRAAVCRQKTMTGLADDDLIDVQRRAGADIDGLYVIETETRIRIGCRIRRRGAT